MLGAIYSRPCPGCPDCLEAEREEHRFTQRRLFERRAELEAVYQSIRDYIDKLREEAEGMPPLAVWKNQRRIADDLSNLIPKEGE